MTSYIELFFHCPDCEAKLKGKRAVFELIENSALYSDGKVITDFNLSTEQRVVICPSCAYVFWLDQVQITECKEEFKLHPPNPTGSEISAYSWQSWHFFGCNIHEVQGIEALFKQYSFFLDFLQPYNQEQEIYLRRRMLWAYNDLYREFRRPKIHQLFTGSMSLRTWIHKTEDYFIASKVLLNHKQWHLSNLNRLIRLISDSFEKDLLFLAELYREAGNFEKAILIMQTNKRPSFFSDLLLKHILNKSTKVFKVAG